MRRHTQLHTQFGTKVGNLQGMKSVYERRGILFARLICLSIPKCSVPRLQSKHARKPIENLYLYVALMWGAL